MGMLSGGANRFNIYQVKNVAGTWTVVQPGTTTAAAGTGDAILVLNKIEQTQLQPQDDGTMQINLDQYQDNPAFYTALKTYAWKQSVAAALAAITFEDGSSEGGSSESGLFLALSHGPVDPDTDDRKITAALGLIGKASGGSTQKNGEYTKPTFAWVGRTAPADIAIPKALCDATLVDALTATDMTLESGLGHDVFWQPKFAA